MVGLPLILGISVLGLTALVQGPGPALRMPTKAFLMELERSPALRIILNRYLFVLMSQLAQSVACHRFHVVEARLARWLLMTRDRAHSNSFTITHEFLSFMLGVRRVGITNAAGALQKRKLITYSRGELSILNPEGLLAASCDCYEIDVAIYKRLMRRRLPAQPIRAAS
jgi:CRP-like cAMP-binding protein